MDNYHAAVGIFLKHGPPSTHKNYCRRHNVRVCLYIAYIACGSAQLFIKSLYFFLTVLVLSAAAIIANIKIRYDVKMPQFAIFGTHVICVFYSNNKCPKIQRIHSSLPSLLAVGVEMPLSMLFFLEGVAGSVPVWLQSPKQK